MTPIILKETQYETDWYGADAYWGVLDRVYIGATWRTRLNRPSAAGDDAALCQMTLTTC